MLENDIRTLKNTSGLMLGHLKNKPGNDTSARASAGGSARSKLFAKSAQMSLNSSVEDNNNQVTELRDLYTQLNRMVENLILRIADQERRLNTITQKVGNGT